MVHKGVLDKTANHMTGEVRLVYGKDKCKKPNNCRSMKRCSEMRKCSLLHWGGVLWLSIMTVQAPKATYDVK